VDSSTYEGFTICENAVINVFIEIRVVDEWKSQTSRFCLMFAIIHIINLGSPSAEWQRLELGRDGFC